MTNEEALDALTREKMCNSGHNPEDCPAKRCEECPWDVSIYEWDDVIDVAINALESKSEAERYRTPKTPINIDGYDYYECPTCGHLFKKANITGKPAFCKRCGQALDWRDWLVAEGDIDWSEVKRWRRR